MRKRIEHVICNILNNWAITWYEYKAVTGAVCLMSAVLVITRVIPKRF